MAEFGIVDMAGRPLRTDGMRRTGLTFRCTVTGSGRHALIEAGKRQAKLFFGSSRFELSNHLNVHGQLDHGSPRYTADLTFFEIMPDQEAAGAATG